MKNRCLNPNATGFQYWGGRGITICKRWMMFGNFLADMGRRPSLNHTLERKENNGNYEPGNCMWATAKQQQLNRSKTMLSLNGEMLSIVEWAKLLGVYPPTIRRRIENGWPIELALTARSGEIKRGRFSKSLFSK